MHERVSVVIPSLGAPSLNGCLDALSRQQLLPDRIIVVLSGGSQPPETGPEITTVLDECRLGFAAAVNRGLLEVPAGTPFVALLNDDAQPSPQWLGTLVSALENRDDLAAVQGTVTDALKHFLHQGFVVFLVVCCEQYLIHENREALLSYSLRELLEFLTAVE